VPYPVLVVPCLAPISVGVRTWIAGSKEVDRAFEAGELAMQGVYALCGHPAYGAATFFVVPGTALLFLSWSPLAVPAVMAVLARLFVRREEEYAREGPGGAHLEYARSVKALFPRA
jgi:protein-S-isoprenylcysteine O-methyltransferase Ste14